MVAIQGIEILLIGGLIVFAFIGLRRFVSVTRRFGERIANPGPRMIRTRSLFDVVVHRKTTIWRFCSQMHRNEQAADACVVCGEVLPPIPDDLPLPPGFEMPGDPPGAGPALPPHDP